MTIFITGSTASHCSSDAHKRSTRFADLLNNSFRSAGFSSIVRTPEIDMTMTQVEEFDSVIVGLAPFTSLSSHRIFPALHTLGLALRAGTGAVLLDAPDPYLVFKSFRSVLANPEILTKKIYSSRDQYGLVASDKDTRDLIMETIETVSNGDVKIIVPSLPYYESTRSAYGIPTSTNHSELISLNLDGFRNLEFNPLGVGESKYWSTDDSKSKWSKAVEKTLAKTVLPLKRTAYDTNNDYIDRLKNSYGCLIPTYKDGLPWWSPNLLLSLSSGTPVYSDWKLTEHLGYFWSTLPHSAEELTVDEKIEHARAQMIYYLNTVVNWEDYIHSASKKLF